jgi:Na+-transporting methylmalonyl-CoA/oxaloacetate decarboxylase gamma subunit
MDNLIWGLQMTGLGMGLVFGLLALLWGLLTIVLRLDQQPAPVTAPAPAPVSEAAVSVAAPMSPNAQGLDADLVAAIVVATHLHRAVRRQEAAPVMRSYWPGSQLYASRWLGAGRVRQNHSWQRRSR